MNAPELYNKGAINRRLIAIVSFIIQRSKLFLLKT